MRTEGIRGNQLTGLEIRLEIVYFSGLSEKGQMVNLLFCIIFASPVQNH